MEAATSFPVDLILFGMIAAFLVLRLRSILGRRTGFERPAPPVQPRTAQPEKGPIIEGRVETPAPPTPVSKTIPEPNSAVGATFARMRQIDASFDPDRFLSGADQAFRMIVAAFAAGDRVALQSLLSQDTYRAFEQAISAREKAEETQISEVKSIQHIGVDAADLRGTIGDVTVRIVSDQVSYVHDKSGRPLTGTDAVTEITDIWTFERDLSQRDPTWRLIAARSG
jgi:predicted lipid-binding transport protein (Tim44 family)